MERYCGTGIPMSLFVCNLWLIFLNAGGNFYTVLFSWWYCRAVWLSTVQCCTFHIAFVIIKYNKICENSLSLLYIILPRLII